MTKIRVEKVALRLECGTIDFHSLLQVNIYYKAIVTVGLQSNGINS